MWEVPCECRCPQDYDPVSNSHTFQSPCLAAVRTHLAPSCFQSTENTPCLPPDLRAHLPPPVPTLHPSFKSQLSCHYPGSISDLLTPGLGAGKRRPSYVLCVYDPVCKSSGCGGQDPGVWWNSTVSVQRRVDTFCVDGWANGMAFGGEIGNRVTSMWVTFGS